MPFKDMEMLFQHYFQGNSFIYYCETNHPETQWLKGGKKGCTKYFAYESAIEQGSRGNFSFLTHPISAEVAQKIGAGVLWCSFIHRSGGNSGSLLGPQWGCWPKHPARLLHASWASLQHGYWVPRVSVLGESQAELYNLDDWLWK